MKTMNGIFDLFRISLAVCLVFSGLLVGSVDNLAPTGLAQEPPPDGKLADFIPAEDLSPANLPSYTSRITLSSEQQTLQSALDTIEQARGRGPEALLALEGSLNGLALELAGPEINRARTILSRSSAGMPNDLASIDRTVGEGCEYDTITKAIEAANPGDRLLLEGGRSFYEAVYIYKDLVIEGGYPKCASNSTDRTIIDATGLDSSVIDIDSDPVVTLRNLVLTGGKEMYGGGIDVYGGIVTLDYTAVAGNDSSFGGGIWISAESIVTATNYTEVYINQASNTGGGIRLYGSFSAEDGTAGIYSNAAPDGGGFAILYGSLILSGANLSENHATGDTGMGGGVLVDSGVITLTNETWVTSNDAYDGGGIYAERSEVHIDNSTVQNNTASNDGGGLYLMNDSLLESAGMILGSTDLDYTNEAHGVGGGMAVITSTVCYNGNIDGNIAGIRGGAIFSRAGIINLTGTSLGGNLLGPGGHEGAGLALFAGSQATLDDTTISGNGFQTTGYTYGGGAYLAEGSAMTLTNQSSIEYHLAQNELDGRGAGIYAANSRINIDYSRVMSNTAGTVGGGIRLIGVSTLDIHNGSTISNNEALNGTGGAIVARDISDINIQNATLQNNTAAGDGGAIYLTSGDLDFSGWVDLRWNSSYANGGAIAVTGTADADLTVTSGERLSFLAANYAAGNGGAIFLANTNSINLYAVQGSRLYLNTNSTPGSGGALYADSGGMFDLCGDIQASSNHASGNGGVIYIGNNSRLWVDDINTTRPVMGVNWAGNGGAIYASGSPMVILEGVDFGDVSIGNSATAGSGGAVYLENSILEADNCRFRNNQATDHGGAVAAYNSSLQFYASYVTGIPAIQTTLQERPRLEAGGITASPCNPLLQKCSNFYANTADSEGNGYGYGGTIYLEGSTLWMSDTYLHENQAVRGGALYVTGAGSHADLKNTLTYNNISTTAFGAGIRVDEDASIDLTHVTLTANTGGAGLSLAATASTSRIFNTIIWDNEFGLLTTPTEFSCNIDQSGVAGLSLNPLFLNPGAANYHLISSSPAVNACLDGLETDLDGYPRPSMVAWDMGAFEFQFKELYLPLVLMADG